MITVLIVDDHPIVRGGLRAAFDADEGIEVMGDAGTGEAAVDLAARARPDVVLMDLQLGAGIDGAETTRRLRALPEPPRVLILTTYDSEADILRAIEAGATGYLLKDAEPADLRAAIRTAARGETVLAPSVATRLVSRVRRPERTLTPRETEVLQMVAAGSGNRAIARALFITEATVKSHLVQVFAKLGVDSRTAATAEARRRGVIR
ncbi:response regulator [Phytomonospora endophytica]|uniref:DNA-binding NarL/FixJ family response regulator n=1 Tax=Phytomonospora endophytica TaxID=714109 RepID=A0A841FLT7_9ACTN|nr:response regulator transcription factor [Phytomonospora endophytica]MBB6033569.1 DNA-binding NarL/FixJ family response regulator [Phytomonospora endophytica]GIG64915.1 DNA-binding response regulator [Phytomonospora endophytica]